MVKVCVVSDNDDFKQDLIMQMTKYIDDFTQDDSLPDVIVADGKTAAAAAVRQQHPTVPIVWLTAENTDSADYLNLTIRKPFSLWQLLDTVVAANNNFDNSDEGFLLFNQYELRPNVCLIIDTVSGAETKLTEKEVNILKFLYKHKDEFVGKNSLQTNVWKYHEEVTTHTIETHIYRLRQKVEKSSDRRLILTDNGKYKLNTEE
jgi:DNA-binding response OmpR family regulator